MRTAFVETANVRAFRNALVAFERRGALEKCLIVVDGKPGLGKTTTLHHWAVQNDCIYLRAKAEWKPRWFLNDLLAALAAPHAGKFEDAYNAAVAELAIRREHARVQKGVFGIVIDEMDHVSKHTKLMETIRDLSEVVMVPTVLVGMGKLFANLTRFPQISSRVINHVTFEASPKADVRTFIRALCDVPVADDLADFVAEATKGFNREVLGAIANIERFARTNRPGEAGVTLRDMAGQFLVNDRVGPAVMVPGGRP